MKILLLGNYELEYKSMQRFAALMQTSLAVKRMDVRLTRPPRVLGRWRSKYDFINKWIGYFDQFLLYPLLLRRQIRWADVVHICDHTKAMFLPMVMAKPCLITCHDMTAIRQYCGEIPDPRLSWSGRILQRWTLSSLRRAPLIVCVSHYTQSDVLRITGLPPDRVAVVENAMNYPYSPMAPAEADARLTRLGVARPDPYILHVGGNGWYKNRAGVLRIFAALRARPGGSAYRLVLAGKAWTAEMRAVAAELGLRDGVLELVDLPSEDLRALYSRAAALLFPSLYEGFGWPIIEAQSCGCPVVVSRLSCLPEVAGDAAAYIDPTDLAHAAETLQAVAADPAARREASLRNAARFSVDAMVSGYLQQYERVVARFMAAG